ncbi:MAG: cupin domain-containing protein [Dehalococcoidales bacterium]|nr:cupin domain-containing protein [Dehalococcoidales bacterium]
MSALKYADYIISRPKPVSPEKQAEFEARKKSSSSTIESTHLMQVDSEVVKDMFYADAVWLWKGASSEKIEEPHVHDFDEVIAFIGSDQANPKSLGGEITIWLDGKKQVIDQTCLIYVPAGAAHCPVIFNRIDTPVMFTTISPSKTYTRTVISEEKAGTCEPKCTVVTEVAEFQGGTTPPPPRPPDSDLQGARVMHLEDHIAKGSFYVDFVWIYKGTGQAPAVEHNHEWEEMIAMAVCDEENPYDMGSGKMSIVLGDETYDIHSSAMVCIPKNLNHCPWKFHAVSKPTLVFTAGPTGNYTGSHRKENA